MQNVQRLACGPQPPQSQRLTRLLLQVFREDREQAGELADRLAFDPFHQSDETVVAPFGRHLEDYRQRRMVKVRMRHLVRPEGPPARLLVAGDLGDVGAEILAPWRDRSSPP